MRVVRVPGQKEKANLLLDRVAPGPQALELLLRDGPELVRGRKRVEKLLGSGELGVDPLPLAVLFDDRQDLAHRPHRLRREGMVGEHLGRGRAGFEIGVAAFDLVEFLKHGRRTRAARQDRRDQAVVETAGLAGFSLAGAAAVLGVFA